MFSNVSNASIWAAAQVQTQLNSHTVELATARKCIPSNGNFTRLVARPIRTIEGAIGGLIPLLVGAMVLTIGLITIGTIVTKNGSTWLKRMVMPFVVVLVILFGLMIAGGIYTAVAAHCTTPFG